MSEGQEGEEVQRVFDALDGVEAMSDDVARARAVSRLLKDQPERNSRLKSYRSNVIKKLRAEGMSFRKIAAEVGVSLGTVQDTLRDHSGSWSDRRKQNADEADGAPNK
ncbi:helix-turn-helix domain-containing protein [Streptomyces sp. NPDC051173]|uniref:helix-turn-helix domain-containing protein n=1 Tax=Streptomyces sp. NPDC051173 TaxID=3155164 RepID=UPI00344F28BB